MCSSDLELLNLRVADPGLVTFVCVPKRKSPKKRAPWFVATVVVPLCCSPEAGPVELALDR